MPAQCVPQNESQRLQMLASLDVLDQPDEGIFSEYVRLAAELLDAPTALVSLLDERRQWFAGRFGLDTPETDRSISFCALTIGQPDEVLWVEDARTDNRFRDNPLVVEGPRIRFYAGAPIQVNGFVVGALCVLSPLPRRRDAAQALVLARLARILAERFERRHCELALQQAIEIAADAIIECDDEGVITAWRLGAERLFGFSAAEAVGQSITLIVPPEFRQAHLDGMARWRAAGAQRLLRRIELSAVRKDGGPIDVELALASRHSHGRPVITTAVRDISHRKAQAASLLQAKVQAESANVAKTAFLANMSHEIRTPLNGVVGIADLLAASPLQPGQAELVEIIRASSNQLQRLLGDVLDLARIESGQFALAQETVSLEEIVSAVADLCGVKARDKGLSFSAEIAPEARRLVKTDPVRLKQVLTNLLANAVKFTERGHVRLRVSERSGRYRFEVEDSGIGFGEEERTIIFSRFQQAESSISRRFGGTGLGLAICRELVSAMGGEIDCAGRPGEGATFWFEAPLEGVQEAPEGGKAHAAPVAHRLDVLLADDNPTNRRVAELILNAAGATVTAVHDGAEAVEAFRRQAFDLVLMDMMMPVMDGVEAVRCIREAEAETAAARTPVIMLTANTLPEHLERSLKAGADLHVPKPITSKALLNAISQVLDAAAL
jgi:PAS domain S-box-containing protein